MGYTTVIMMSILVSAFWGVFAAIQKWVFTHGLPVESVLVASTVTYGIFSMFIIIRAWSKLSKDVHAHPKQWGVLVLASVFLSFIPYLLYLYALQMADSHIVVALVATSPLFTLLASMLLLQERVSWLSMVGLCFIVIGTIMISLHMKRT